jgi:hypothetical protein
LEKFENSEAQQTKTQDEDNRHYIAGIPSHTKKNVIVCGTQFSMRVFSKKKEYCRTFFGSVEYPNAEPTKNSSARKKLVLKPFSTPFFLVQNHF